MHVDPYDHPEQPISAVDPLSHHRTDIDRLDRVIVALLAERLRLGFALGELKRAQELPLRCDNREDEVLSAVRHAAQGCLSPEAVVRIFNAVIAETRAIQEEQR